MPPMTTARNAVIQPNGSRFATALSVPCQSIRIIVDFIFNITISSLIQNPFKQQQKQYYYRELQHYYSREIEVEASHEQHSAEEEIDCIIVLGAGIRGNGPSPMLEDRLLTSIELYNKNISNKVIVSGDHGRVNYDEVNVMKNYLKKI